MKTRKTSSAQMKSMSRTRPGQMVWTLFVAVALGMTALLHLMSPSASLSLIRRSVAATHENTVTRPTLSQAVSSAAGMNHTPLRRRLPE